MNSRIDQLVKTLLQKDNIEQCSLDELKDYAERHPYFGAAQLLLTKKLQAEEGTAYEEQFQKTLLFFHNPLWVEHLLNENGTARIEQGGRMEVRKVEAEAEVKIEAEAEVEVEAETRIEEEKKEAVLMSSEPIEELNGEPVKSEGETLKKILESPAVPAETELSFEPYHTVDYFASQGIKFREEEKPADKLGQQLKSFTEWLKTMKRLPVSEVAATVPAVAERKVEEMAERSLKDREVITEAMAEVWEKQGNHEKAIETYSKLSLLEPSKSAYFAAKIEELKK